MQKIKYMILAIIFLVLGIFIGKDRGIPFIGTKGEWSIGIYSGPSLTELKPITNNPVLTATRIIDRNATFVADPFMIEHKGIWYMFFEVFDSKKRKGVIGLATSYDRVSWSYDSIILDEPFHLSYPQVFSYKGEFYMIPESRERYAVVLYKANPFPRKWELISKLFEGFFCDPTLLHYNGLWWIFTTDDNANLRLFLSKKLEGGWQEHLKSPLIKNDPRIARPAGRILSKSGLPFRVSQDDSRYYGEAVNIFRIKKLDEENYEEVALMNRPLFQGTGQGWNAKRMHHLDAHELPDGSWYACVDGYNRRIVFGLKE